MPAPEKRPPRRPVTVVDVDIVTPRTVRVTVNGELADWPEPGPAAHMKVFLPDTPSGPVMRTYTVRRFDRERGLVAIDFFLSDGAGPATQWASRVVPGMRLELSGRARSGFTPEPGAASYLFAGDESALPAIATCLEALPASAAATAIIEVSDAQECQPLGSAATVDGSWLYAGEGDGLPQAVLEAAAASDYDLVWVACEAGTMREIKRSLLDAGTAPERLKTRGYWKRGAVDHPDHDTGEDVG
jgi:NADPH-dependent ferric siderophore reductase